MSGPAMPVHAADFMPPDQELLQEVYLKASQPSTTQQDGATRVPEAPRYYTGSGLEDLDEFLEGLQKKQTRGHWYYKSPQEPAGAARHPPVDQQEILRRKVEAAVQKAKRAEEQPASRLGCALVEGVLRTEGRSRRRRDGNPLAGQESGAGVADVPSLLQQVLSTANCPGKKAQPEPSDVQNVLRKYRSVLRIENQKDQKAAAMVEKQLAFTRNMVRDHGLWLGSFSEDAGEGKGERRRTFGEKEERASFWRQMADDYDVPNPPETAFRRGKAVYARPGVRSSVDPAKDAGRVVRRLGSLLAVCRRDFEAERQQPSQALLTRTMALAAKAEKLRFHLRPRLLLALLRALQSPANPPGICNVNIQRLHDAWQASGAHNPQPWVLGRAQLVGVLLANFRGVDRGDAQRLVSCYDLGSRDRVRFAEISANLIATMPPSLLLLQSVASDIGLYRLVLTALRQMFRLYAHVTCGRLRYGTLLELLRSCTAHVQGIAVVDDAFRLFMAEMGHSLKDECTEETLIQDLKTQIQRHEHGPADALRPQVAKRAGGVSSCLLDVCQRQVQAFQALAQTHAEEQARQRLWATTVKP